MQKHRRHLITRDSAWHLDYFEDVPRPHRRKPEVKHEIKAVNTKRTNQNLNQMLGLVK